MSAIYTNFKREHVAITERRSTLMRYYYLFRYLLEAPWLIKHLICDLVDSYSNSMVCHLITAILQWEIQMRFTPIDYLQRCAFILFPKLYFWKWKNFTDSSCCAMYSFTCCNCLNHHIWIFPWMYFFSCIFGIPSF